MNPNTTALIEKQILWLLMRKLLGFNPVEMREAMEKFICMPQFEWLAFIVGDTVNYYQLILENLKDFIKDWYHFDKDFDTAWEQFLIFYQDIEENLKPLIVQTNEYLSDYIMKSVSLTTLDEFENDYHTIKQQLLAGEI